MFPTTSIMEPRPEIGPFSIFLRLNAKREIMVLQEADSRFSPEGGYFDGKFENAIPLNQPEVYFAISTALSGQPAITRYQLRVNDAILHFELHCFPERSGAGNDVCCFLMHRTVEEEDAEKLQAKIYILDLIGQAVKAFSETRNLSEILRIILLSVTAGPGLGFNRGFVLLSNESRTHLWGCLATGPSTPEEAGIIWQNLARRSLTLEEILRLYKSSSHNAEDIHVNKLVASLKIPLNDDANFIVRAVKECQSVITYPEMMQGPSNQELKEKFGIDHMAVVPLASREGLQGVLLADNLITRKTITEGDLKVLEIFARYASDAIENSRLYGKLEQQVSRLKEANEKIIKTRENLIRAERLSSVAKMALDVAHEIRNPLTVIGGYANSHLRKITPEEPSYKILDIISKQADRIEKALDNFSSVVSMSEKKEGKYLLSTLVRETLGMLSASANPEIPNISVDAQAEEICIWVDQGLFHQAMMVILRQASEVAGGMLKIAVHVVKSGRSGTILIMGGDDFPGFAEEFYRSPGASSRDLEGREMAVALEILQHYGGGLGVLTGENSAMHLYVEFPLCEEGR